MTLVEFKTKLKSTPEALEFSETMGVIEGNYIFTPTAFCNGDLENESGQNLGSCKLFAFANKEGLSKEEALACFGKYYKDVQNTPEGIDHQNIRNFMKTGFEGLIFKGDALKEK